MLKSILNIKYNRGYIKNNSVNAVSNTKVKDRFWGHTSKNSRKIKNCNDSSNSQFSIKAYWIQFCWPLCFGLWWRRPLVVHVICMQLGMEISLCHFIGSQTRLAILSKSVPPMIPNDPTSKDSSTLLISTQ